MSTTILLVDDQTLVREGIRALLQLMPDIEVVAEACDGQQALAEITRTNPDVVLLDIRMPVMSGVEVLEKLKNYSRQPAVLVLTTFDDHDLVLNCIKLGAKGYLRKDVNFDDLTDAIVQLAAGNSWLQPALSSNLNLKAIQQFAETQGDTWREGHHIKLSKMELQVLRLVAAGYSNHEIADALFKSSGTIRNQVSSILTKLDVRDRTRAVIKALELGLLKSEKLESE